MVLSRGLLFRKLLIVIICYRWFRRSQNLQEDQEPLLERMRLEHQKADLETKIEHLEADVAYLRSDYLFLNDGDKKEAMFATICGLDFPSCNVAGDVIVGAEGSFRYFSFLASRLYGGGEVVSCVSLKD